MPPASSSSPKKARASASPSKAKTKSPGIRKRQLEWKESLPPLWVKQANFRHPARTRTITKTNAEQKYKLNDREIKTLPYEQGVSEAGYPMQLYSEIQVRDLALKKCAKLETELEVNGVVYQSPSGSSETGSVSVVSFRNPPQLPDWMERIVNPQPPPLKVVEYTRPSHPDQPDPESIIWTPSKLSGSVSVADACRLYCIEPTDIQDLSAHSPWIDLSTVAKRALTLHGGFYAHKKLVLQRREAEEQKLTREVPEAYKRKSPFRFSSMVQKEWDSDDEDAWMYETSGGTQAPKHRVAVFYPIEYVRLDDYGCMWEWMPYWEDF